MGPRGGGHWPFLAGLASSAPHWATLGSLTPAVGLGQCPKVWDLGGLGRVYSWPVGISLSRADIDQLKRIMEVVGTPSPEVLAKISSEHVSHHPPAPSANQAPGCSGGRGSVK